jgi:hypothetical protein
MLDNFLNSLEFLMGFLITVLATCPKCLPIHILIEWQLVLKLAALQLTLANFQLAPFALQK